jgi:hypothetical protein
MNILYYSNYCKNSNTILQKISRFDNRNGEFHFICVDKRVKEKNDTFIILENNSRILLPPMITHVPALLLLNNGCDVIYGEKIVAFFQEKMAEKMKQATNQFMEPLAFSLTSSSGSNIVSDSYSFLDTNVEDMTATGNGGARQMHNYVDLSLRTGMEQEIAQQQQGNDYGNKIPPITNEQLKQQWQNEVNSLNSNQKRGW